MLVELVRLVVTLGVLAASYRFGEGLAAALHLPVLAPTGGLLVTIVCTGLAYALSGVGARALDNAMTQAERRLSHKHVSEVIAGTLGLLVGLAAAALMSMPLLFIGAPELVMWPAVALLLIVSGSFGMRYATRKRLELFGVLGVAPIDQTGTAGGSLLDSSAAIDGRVLSLAKAGLLPTPLCVPAFVLWELQSVADSSDPTRRRRGQRGLEILKSLRESNTPVRVLDEDPAAMTEPDAKLMILAKRHGIPIVTSDSNLAAAAEVQGLRVLNLHALAELARPQVSAGDRLDVALTKTGREAGQAVGYLDDGTMVIVERSSEHVGRTIEAEVTSVLQTPTGRMLFARPADPQPV